MTAVKRKISKALGKSFTPTDATSSNASNGICNGDNLSELNILSVVSAFVVCDANFDLNSSLKILLPPSLNYVIFYFKNIYLQMK
mgnify:CR=1 FL=1